MMTTFSGTVGCQLRRVSLYKVEWTRWFCLQLLQECYITVLFIHGLTVMLLVQGRGEMAGLPTDTAVLLLHSAMDRWTDGNIVSTE
jgi:hypothetical protein